MFEYLRGKAWSERMLPELRAAVSSYAAARAAQAVTALVQRKRDALLRQRATGRTGFMRRELAT